MRPLPKISFLITWAAVAATAIAAPQYQIFDLGVLQMNDVDSRGHGVSPGGIVVGYSGSGNGGHAFTWTLGGGLIALPLLSGRNSSIATSANDNGTVVGRAFNENVGGSSLPAIWQNGVVSQLPLPGSFTVGQVFDVNASGIAVGSAGEGGEWEYAAIYSVGGSSVITATAPHGSQFSTAYGINDSGRIVGVGFLPSNPLIQVGIVYDMSTNTILDVGTLPGATSTMAIAVNNNGQVVGSSNRRPFIWTEGSGMVAIPLLPGKDRGDAQGVNSAGWVVGTDWLVNSSYAPFLYDGTTTYRLADLLPPGSGWVLNGYSPLSINNNGVIVGTGLHNNTTRAFAMVPLTGTPTPTPTGTPSPSPTSTPTPVTPSPTPTPSAAPTPTPCTGIVYYFRENFDGVTAPALPAGWVTNFTPGAANCTPTGTCALGTNWATSTTTPHTPPNCAFHDAPGCVTDSILETPDFIGGGSGSFLFLRHSYDLENGLDGAVVEISIDGGPFVDFVAAGGGPLLYNGTISSGSLSPIAGRSAFTGNSGGYVSLYTHMPPVFGKKMRLRFRLATDCSGAGTGWRIDSVSVEANFGCPTPTIPPPPTPTASPTPTATASPGPLDGFDPNANGTIRAVLIQPDGRILLGGAFTTLSPNGGGAVARNSIARLNVHGTLDTAFNPNANGPVNAIALQADGKILVGGEFGGIGGQTTRNHIARLDPTTGQADSWDPNANMAVNTIAVQADGKILVGGEFQSVNSIGGQMRNRIARLDPITGLADSWDPNAGGSVYSIVVQADGKILVGGFFDVIGVLTREYMARLDPTTGWADSFHPQPNSYVASIAVQADGKVLAGGGFTSVRGQPRRYIARFDSTTGLADSFNPNANGFVNAMAVQADGKILAGGGFTNIGGQARNRIARLDPATGLADSFDPNANPGNPNAPVGGAADASATPATTPKTPASPTPTPTPSLNVRAIAVQADGKILVGGGFTTLAPNGGAPVTRNRIARLETDGRLDQTLEDLHTVGDAVYSTALQPDGKILIGGGFTAILGVPRNNIARLNADGSLDLAFNPNADSAVETIAVQADGKILVGGVFQHIGGVARSRIARLDATTGLPDSFNPNADSIVWSIAVQSDGKVLVGGGFNNIGGTTRNYIARLDATTGLADSFNPNATSTVFSLTVQTDGKILVGGHFLTIGGQTRHRMARLDPVTGLADSFNPNASGAVHTMVVHPDGRILAGGDFRTGLPPYEPTIGGQYRNHIARLNPTTGLADSFNPAADETVESIAIQADGRILVGGLFSNIGGQTRGRVARLDPITGLADSFNPIANFYVRSIALQADGKILAGGSFNAMGGVPRTCFARISNDTAALQNLAATQTTITWTRGGAGPHFARVTFESSSDNVNYTLLGNGTASGSNWILTGLNFPLGQNFFIRARGYYRSGWHTGSESIAESVRNAFVTSPDAPHALNLSTRLRVQTGDNAGIGGFIITGNAPKYLLFRGIGPSLNALGITNALANPTLDLRRPDGTLILANDNWRDTQEPEILATGIPPTNDLEAAIVQTLNPGSYTVILRGMGLTTGIGLVEIYDLSLGVGSKLANISTRAFVDTGEDIVIAGFIVGGGSGSDRMIMRGIGPSLAAVGVGNALGDPILELRNGNGVLLRTNNDWQDDPAQAAELTAAGLAPGNQLESGIAMTLSPGAYTALLAGLNNGSGVGLVEVYDLGAPP